MGVLSFFQKRSIWRIGLLSSQSNMALLLSGTVGALEMKETLMSGAGPEIMRLPKIKITTEHKRGRKIDIRDCFVSKVCHIFKSSEFYLIELSCSWVSHFAVVFLITLVLQP